MHPYSIYRDRETYERISRSLAELEVENHLSYFAAQWLGLKQWWPERHMDLQLVSPPLHWIGNHYTYEQLCE